MDKLLNFLIFFPQFGLHYLCENSRHSYENFNLMNRQYLRIEKKIYNEEHSFPSVYRELIKDIESDLAITIIDELKKNMRSTKKFFTTHLVLLK